MDQNQATLAYCMNDKDFQRVVADWMRRQVYDEFRAQPPEGVPTADPQL